MAQTGTYTEAVREAVRAAIAASGFTITAVAEGAGIPQATLSRNLNGAGVKGSPFHVSELESIAHFLSIPVEQLSAPERAA